MSPGQTNSKRYALIIGNASYQDKDPLTAPLHDVEELAKLLQDFSFEVTVLKNATRRKQINATSQLIESIQTPHDIVLFYYAGHGIQINGSNYLIPVDAKIAEDGWNVPYETQPLQQLLGDLEECPAGAINLVILDIGYDHHFAIEDRKNMQIRGLAPIKVPDHDTLMLCATQPNTVIEKPTDSPQGRLVKHLLEIIRRDPYQNLEEIFRQTADAVSQASQQQQIPWLGGKLSIPFALATSLPTTTVASSQIKHPTTPKKDLFHLVETPSFFYGIREKIATLSIGWKALLMVLTFSLIGFINMSLLPESDDDQLAWEAAKRCGTGDCYDYYLKNYPQGRFVQMALVKKDPKKSEYLNAQVNDIRLSFWEKGKERVSTWFNMRVVGGFYHGKENAASLARGVWDAIVEFPQNTVRAARWLSQSGQKGIANFQYFIGLTYELGQGVSRDYAKAALWYQKAALRGDTEAQYKLGVMYWNGYGLTQDRATAIDWYQKSANQGNSLAQYNLGVAYWNGHQVTKDDSQALHWYQLAANQDNLAAQNNLAVMYWHGYGTPQNQTKALEWCKRAASQGSERAKQALATLRTR